MKGTYRKNLLICTDTESGMADAEVIILVDYDPKENQEMTTELKAAKEKGSKVVLINTKKKTDKRSVFAHREIYCENAAVFFRQISKVLIQLGCGQNLQKYAELKESVKAVRASVDAQWLAILYQLSRKAMIVTKNNAAAADYRRFVEELAELAGHAGKYAPCGGINETYEMAV